MHATAAYFYLQLSEKITIQVSARYFHLDCIWEVQKKSVFVFFELILADPYKKLFSVIFYNTFSKQTISKRTLGTVNPIAYYYALKCDSAICTAQS